MRHLTGEREREREKAARKVNSEGGTLKRVCVCRGVIHHKKRKKNTTVSSCARRECGYDTSTRGGEGEEE